MSFFFPLQHQEGFPFTIRLSLTGQIAIQIPGLLFKFYGLLVDGDVTGVLLLLQPLLAWTGKDIGLAIDDRAALIIIDTGLLICLTNW